MDGGRWGLSQALAAGDDVKGSVRCGRRGWQWFCKEGILSVTTIVMSLLDQQRRLGIPPTLPLSSNVVQGL